MPHREYHIVFRGNILPTTSVQAVKSHLAKLFGADEARIEKLFSGRPVIIKKGLGREEAETYRLRLEQAGALCEIMAVPGAPPPAVPGGAEAAPAVKADADRPPSPSVGTEQDPVKPFRPLDPKPPFRHSRAKEPARDVPGEDILSALAEITAPLRSLLAKTGAAEGRKRRLVPLGAAAAVAIVAAVLMLSGGSRPMPIEPEVFDRFAQQYHGEIHKADLATVGTRVLIDRAREVVEDMGFDFDRTLLLWFFRQDLVESRGGLEIYRTILVEPVAVAVAAGLSGVDKLIAPETRQIFATAAAIPSGVDLAAIRMLRDCPFDGYRLKHGDLLRVLQAHDVPVDAGTPDLSIADAFFGLEQAGFVHIHRRWENDVQFSDIEILAPDALRLAEEQLAYLADRQKAFTMP